MQDNVTQADREAAKAYVRNVFEAPLGKEYSLDEAFAAHRIASTTAQTELVEALEAISQHAGHTEECSFYWDGGQSCDCGYLAAHVKKAQALAAHRESQP